MKIQESRKDEITWHDFAKLFKPDISVEETMSILSNETAWPFGGFHYNASMMKEYFERNAANG